MVPFSLKVLAKFGVCSNCSRKLDLCSLGRARKIISGKCFLVLLTLIETDRPESTREKTYLLVNRALESIRYH